MKRRDFLTAAGAVGMLGAAGCSPTPEVPPLPPGVFEGADFARGHLLRQGEFPPPSETRRHPVAIIGGGIAGLSAAWRLKRGGVDFGLYELEDSVGGNARNGENEISAYPLGAHYLPLPPLEARGVRLLLADLGMLTGDVDAPHASYDEAYLCQAPQERLYRHGTWQEGVIPSAHLTPEERRQSLAFLERMAGYQRMKGRDGKRAFALPSALSSADPELRALDRLSMKQWMLSQGWDAAPLHWYVDYACRDDFGLHHDAASAWVGIHYFACRGDSGQGSNTNGDVVLTAPEGNGWIVKRLAAQLQPQLHPGAMAVRVGRLGGLDHYADVYDIERRRTVRIVAPQIILAVPTHVLPHIWPDMPEDMQAAAAGIVHAPWLVANVSLSRMPEERRGAPLSWDNVLYESQGLGYVVATHQKIRTRPGPTVFTCYRALADADVNAARRTLLETPREKWAELVLAELERVHPDIRQIATRVDIARWGHAMARPAVGSLWNSQRPALARRVGGIQLAHADLSGFSIFEEAHYHGVRSAENVLATLGKRERSVL